MYSLVRPLLFKMDAEQAHHCTLSALTIAPKSLFKQPQGEAVQALGLNFSHPVGLAAGLDKNGRYLDALAKLGFSSIELGTITPKPQPGNSRPRLFRLPEAQAIINRMGFNNEGVDALVSHIERAKYNGILGINIGKNKDTPLDKAAEDYLLCMRKVYQHASYIAVNVSSPNTPDLRQLQQGDYFSDLLKQLHEARDRLSQSTQRRVPLLIKVSPDEQEETLKQMSDAILKYGIDGVIATNTTARRDMLADIPHALEQGGLSGKPVQQLSLHCLRLLRQYMGADVTLIGVGGINDLASAQAKLDAGASLIQLYSGLIYQGPDLVYQLASQLKNTKR